MRRPNSVEKELQVKVAALCGWVDLRWDDHYDPPILFGVRRLTEDKERLVEQVPDYSNDLNAAYALEEYLAGRLGKWGSELFQQYEYVLGLIVGQGEHFRWKLLHATAAQRAEAFVLVMEGCNDSSRNSGTGCGGCEEPPDGDEAGILAVDAQRG